MAWIKKGGKIHWAGATALRVEEPVCVDKPSNLSSIPWTSVVGENLCPLTSTRLWQKMLGQKR